MMDKNEWLMTGGSEKKTYIKYIKMVVWNDNIWVNDI